MDTVILIFILVVAVGTLIWFVAKDFRQEPPLNNTQNNSPAAQPAPVVIDASPNMKCPYCKMEIDRTATVCPYCRKNPQAFAVVGDSLKKTGCALMQLPFLILGLILSGLILWCSLSLIFSK